jgi:hypothetical protein
MYIVRWDITWYSEVVRCVNVVVHSYPLSVYSLLSSFVLCLLPRMTNALKIKRREHSFLFFSLGILVEGSTNVLVICYFSHFKYGESLTLKEKESYRRNLIIRICIVNIKV